MVGVRRRTVIINFARCFPKPYKRSKLNNTEKSKIYNAIKRDERNGIRRTKYQNIRSDFTEPVFTLRVELQYWITIKHLYDVAE